VGTKIKAKKEKKNKDNISTQFKIKCMRSCKNWRAKHISKEHISLANDGDEHSQFNYASNISF
jgi:hypothetical protein